MKFTGEQLVPGTGKKRLDDEHFERYDFASKFVKNKKVLDIACGTGYGTKTIGTFADKVVGVDISEEAINFAKKDLNNDKVEFILSSATEDIFPEDCFDVICSFETIEHMNVLDRRKYLKNLCKWLKYDGTLLLSTPNKKITSPFSEKPLNEFHVLEFTREQLLSELKEYFNIEKVYGQRLVRKFLTYYFIRKFIHLIQKIIKKDFNLYSLANGPEILEYNEFRYEPRIFVVVANQLK